MDNLNTSVMCLKVLVLRVQTLKYSLGIIAILSCIYLFSYQSKVLISVLVHFRRRIEMASSRGT